MHSDPNERMMVMAGRASRLSHHRLFVHSDSRAEAMGQSPISISPPAVCRSDRLRAALRCTALIAAAASGRPDYSGMVQHVQSVRQSHGGGPDQCGAERSGGWANEFDLPWTRSAHSRTTICEIRGTRLRVECGTAKRRWAPVDPLALSQMHSDRPHSTAAARATMDRQRHQPDCKNRDVLLLTDFQHTLSAHPA